MITENGRLLSVRKQVAGTILVTATATGDQTLFVDGVTDFSESGGQLVLPDGVTVKNYDAIDFIANTIHLTTTVGVVLAAEDEIRVYPLSPEYEADVALDDETGQVVQATVPIYIVPFIPTGIEDPQFGPGVLLESNDYGDWRVVDVFGVEPSMDMEFGDPTTFPPTTTDGNPPSAAATVTLIAGLGVIHARWTAVLNSDAIEYEVHVSTSPGFTPSAGTLVLITPATAATIKNLQDGTPLAYNTTYYVRVVPIDADGAGPASTEVSASPVQVNTPDIVANSIISDLLAANSITADKLSAVLVLAGLIKTAESGQRVEIDNEGMRGYHSDETLHLNLPNDPLQEAFFRGELEAAILQVTGLASFEDELNIEAGAEELLQTGLTNPTAKPTVVSQWDVQDIGTNETHLDYYRYGLVYTATGGAGGATPSFAFVNNPDDTGDFEGLQVVEVTAAAPQTVARKSAVWGSASAFTPMGLTKHGSDYYVLIQFTAMNSFRVLRFTGSTLALSNTYDPTADLNTFVDEMHIGSDGTNIFIVDRAGGSSPTFYRFRRFDASMNFVSSTTSDYDPGTGPDSFAGCSMVVRDDGSGTRWWLGAQDNANNTRMVHSFNTSGVHQTNECFPTPSGYIKGLAHDGTRFWSLSSNSLMARHTNWRWTTESPNYWVGYTWYDDAGTAHETAISPRQNITMNKRSKMTISTPAIPVGGADDPNKVRIYINRGASEPQASGRFAGYLQVTDALTNRDLQDFDAVGTTPENPASNNFPAGTPGLIRSTLDDANVDPWEARGDGTMLLPAFDPSVRPSSPVERQVIYDKLARQPMYHDGLLWRPYGWPNFFRWAGFVEDFVGLPSQGHVSFTGGGANNGTAVSTIATHPGRVITETGTATNGNGRFFGTGFMTDTQGGLIYFAAIVSPPSTASDGTNRYDVKCGLYDNAVEASITDGIYFFYQDNLNSGNWQARVRDGGVLSTDALDDNGGAVAVDSSWFLLEFIVNAAGTQVDFYINRVFKGSIALSSVLNDIEVRGGIEKKLGTANRQCDWDLIAFQQEITSQRWT